MTFLFVPQVPSHILMGIRSSTDAISLSPLGEACVRKDLTAIHEILENLGYKDDEGATTEVCYFSYDACSLECQVGRAAVLVH